MSPFPQSVAVSSTSPAVFLSSPAVIQVPLFTSVFLSISNGHTGFVDKVS